MNLDRSVTLFAGFMVLASVLLTQFVSPYFMWFTVFIGVNLIQSSMTGFCPAASAFRMMGIKSGCAFK
jgi:small-conductance mechanosensitive channel